MRVSVPYTLFITLIHASLLSAQNDETAAEVPRRMASEDYKPRRWSQTGGEGPYRMVVSARDHQDHGGLEPNESVAYVVAIQDNANKKNLNNKSDSLDKASVVPMWDEFGEKYDKVTQRVFIKRGRKRERLMVDSGERKRRRNPISSTTGLPQTMSYNLYNHFRPVERGVPQEAILPFLDFGRKLSTGPTPSAINSIEGSSTPRSNPISVTPLVENEDLFHEEMDVAVTKKAVERNSVPKEILHPRVPEVSSFFQKKTENEEGAESRHSQVVHPVVKIIERRANLTKIASESSLNISNSAQFPIVVLSTITKHNDTILTNKTETTERNSDLTFNESGVKYHAVISPEKLAELKKLNGNSAKTNLTSFNATRPKENEDAEKVFNDVKLEAIPLSLGLKASPENKTRGVTNETEPTVKTKPTIKIEPTVKTEPTIKVEPTIKTEPAIRTEPSVISEASEPLNITLNTTSSNEDTLTTQDYAMTPLPLQQTTTISPSPTPRILSTAVVTSVSVKESPRNPRLKGNHTTPKLNATIPLQNNSTFHNPSVLFNENRTAFSNLQNIMRRKLYTTLRPKSTFKPVTFRSTFRRNFTKTVPAVVRVVSTPPSYIEVPKILTRVRPRIGTVPLHSEGAKAVHIEPVISSTLSTLAESVETKTTTEQAEKQEVSQTGDDQTNTETLQPTTVSPSPIEVSSTRLTERQQPVKLVTTKAPLTTFPPTFEEPTVPHLASTEAPETSTNVESFESDKNEVTTEGVLKTQPDANDTLVIDIKPIGSYVPPESVDATKEVTLNKTKETLPSDTSPSTTEGTPKSGILKTEQGLGIRPIPPWNLSTGRPGSSTIGPVYPDSLSVASYILAALAIVPLILGIFVLVRQVLQKSKKKVLDESEYSSEYNRSPLPTKLPRLPAHIASEPRQFTLNWEEEKTSSSPPIPMTKWEFSREKLRLQTVLGQGNFGQVWKAEADDISGHEGLTRLVAVKTVKEGGSQREKEDLLRELGIMQELGSHPNVVTLLGCCTEKEPYLLIMEYVMYGKLLAFLREHRTRAHYFNFSDLSSALTSRDLTVFAYCVARGMEFLVSKGIIHRDLAARNILVDHNKLCKIADFGMSRNVRDTGQIYEQRPSRGALPIRWMAPESLHYSLFTHKSDVWSFGILLWEIITLGSTPYNTMSGREVMRQVKDGYRLDKPKHCKSEFYRVVNKCWHSDPAKRPTFSDLKQEIGGLLGDKDSEGGYVDLEALAEEMSESSN